MLLEFPSVPVNCSALHASAPEAQSAPTGSLRLVLCPACGYVCNQDFDPSLLTYDAAYENALDFSPSFREYLDELANDLVVAMNSIYLAEIRSELDRIGVDAELVGA